MAYRFLAVQMPFEAIDSRFMDILLAYAFIRFANSSYFLAMNGRMISLQDLSMNSTVFFCDLLGETFSTRSDIRR